MLSYTCAANFHWILFINMAVTHVLLDRTHRSPWVSREQSVRVQIPFVIWNVGVYYHCTLSGDFYSYAVDYSSSFLLGRYPEVPLQIPIWNSQAWSNG